MLHPIWGMCPKFDDMGNGRRKRYLKAQMIGKSTPPCVTGSTECQGQGGTHVFEESYCNTSVFLKILKFLEGVPEPHRLLTRTRMNGLGFGDLAYAIIVYV